ncbi:MAG: nucleotide exchange factor GrpE [Phycisphaeraceae bacterium]|nr:nucleotide exchange factor GrpE [Phycisphaeraceae bacterium]
MQKEKTENNNKDQSKAEIKDDVKDQDQVVEEETPEAESNEEEEVDETEQLKSELSESKDKYLRLYSEFENFRRRTAKEKLDLIGSATKDLISDLLPVLDDFERAFKSIDEKADSGSAKEGIELIFNKLSKILEQKGLKKVEVKSGDKFDDELHEAITQTPAGKKMEGKIVDVIENGYSLNDKVIRFAKVVTGAKS